jgi:alpha,alpha-trehalose phosphorylase
MPYDAELGVHEQSAGFTRHRHWDFARTRPDQYPLLLHFPYYELYRSQVVKQADLVLALYLCGERFDADQKARDFDYYEAITVRDSSLSASLQAIVAAEVGHLELALDYLGESAFVDLHDLSSDTCDGVHLASLAASWLAVVAGFGGMRDQGDVLAFAPRLPRRLDRLSFRLIYRGRCLRVEVVEDEARYQLLDGAELELLHHGTRFTLRPGSPACHAVPTAPARPVPEQPAGREPLGVPGLERAQES